MREIQVNDRVQFKAAFLRSVGAYAHPMAFMKGTVQGINGIYVTVLWDGDNATSGAHKGNLHIIGTYEAN